MARGKLEGGAHLTLCLALTDQTAVAPRAQCKGKRIEQNRFAGPGLAGQNGKSSAEIEIELVDQNDIADRERNEHGVEGLPEAPSSGAASALYIFYGNRKKLQIADPMTLLAER